MSVQAPEQPIQNLRRGDPADIQRLADLPLVLYALAQGAKLFWSIVCKRWPELK
jgi:hypothetical protein